MNEFLVGPGLTDVKNPVTTNDPDSWYPRPASDGSKWSSNSDYVHLYNSDQPLNQSRLVAPSMTCLLAEPIVENASAGGATYAGKPLGAVTWQSTKGYFNTQAGADTFYGYGTDNPTATQHGGNVNNYAFCDGHVKALHPQKQGYDITAGSEPMNNIWLVADGRNGDALPTTPN
jgi:prepilin-type processing-associated H-X9-DG protein